MVDRIISIAWKKWRLVFTKDLPRDTVGATDPPTKKRKAIRIRSELVGQEFLDTFLHETHHAGNDTINEDYVSQIATDQAEAFCKPDCLSRFLTCPKIESMVREILDNS
tara:strand:+ start:534 stop:860 length:327 start_codon:yes stop_codon:yes gene_type:complete